MAITDILENARISLYELVRNRRFKKANLSRQEAIDLQVSLAKCRGELELCLKDFDRTVVDQCRYIKEGLRLGADTAIQEQMLWDAAIGYMLVRESIYALKTISSHDSISHAYEMLDAATDHMIGKKTIFPPFRSKKRNIYGYVTSNAAVEEKSNLLETFFDKLKLTGDIEACLREAKNPAHRQADLRTAYTKGHISADLQRVSDVPANAAEEAMKRLSALDSLAISDEDFEDLNTLVTIKPPKETKEEE